MSNNKELARELAEVKTRLVAAETEIARLQNGSPPPKKKVAAVEPGARLVRLVDQPRADMPTDSELAKLRELVFSKYEGLRPRQNPLDRFDAMDQRESELGYRAAFIWLGTLRRTEKLVTKFHPTAWGDGADDYRRSLQLGGTCSGHSVVTAAIAWGDIDFSLDGWPHQLNLALAFQGGSGRPPDAAGWRGVLQNGVTLAPLKMPAPTHVWAPHVPVVDLLAPRWDGN